MKILIGIAAVLFLSCNKNNDDQDQDSVKSGSACFDVKQEPYCTITNSGMLLDYKGCVSYIYTSEFTSPRNGTIRVTPSASDFIGNIGGYKYTVEVGQYEDTINVNNIWPWQTREIVVPIWLAFNYDGGMSSLDFGAKGELHLFINGAMRVYNSTVKLTVIGCWQDHKTQFPY